MINTARTLGARAATECAPLKVFLRRHLPHGRTLPAGEWQRRHHGIIVLLVVLGGAVPLYGVANGHQVSHNLLGGFILLATAILASRIQNRRTLSSTLTSFGLCAASGLAIHVADGAIEAHFMFFVVIIIISLYEDWRPFLVAFGFVLLHHGVMGVVDHSAVYNHAGNPFVLAAGIACVVHWRINETVRAELESVSNRATESDARFRSAFQHGPIGMAVVGANGDQRGTLLQVNRTLRKRLALPECELKAATLGMLLAPAELERVLADMDALVAGDLAVAHDELPLMHRDGYSFDGRISMSLVGGQPRRSQQVIVQVEDVTESNRLKHKLQDLADHDPLTGMLNRRRFNEELTRQIEYGRRYGADGSGGAVVLLDLDGFKEINDTLGHEAGDEVLIAVANALTKRLRTTDTLARLGGDEFAIVLPEATAEAAHTVAQAIVDTVADCAVTGSGDDARESTASVGVVVYAAASDVTGDQLLNDADLAMYEAKDGGGNCCVVYSADTGGEADGNPAWPERIRKALDDERFAMFAQPILDTRTGDITHFELLLRMIGVDGETIAPGAFLPVAERRGMIRTIDRWVIRQALGLLQEPVAEDAAIRLQVNISGRSLSDPDFLRYVRAELAEADVDPRKLIFEVTETAAIANVEDASAFLSSLSELGCGIALDDFGAGFGSLHYLKNLPIDYLKIDGQFIQNLTTNPDDLVVVESLIRMASGLRMRTAAEYVEDPATLQLVRDLGVDFAQGYHIGRPGPARYVIASMLRSTATEVRTS